MMDFDKPAPIDEPEVTQPKRGRKEKRPQYSNPVTASARMDVVKAAGKGGDSVGTEKHKQLTFRLPWGWVDELEAWADQLGVSKEEMKRYLVRRGLDALKAGERPQVEPVAVRNVVRYD